MNAAFESVARVDGRGAWLFSRTTDLAVFAGPAVVSLLLVVAGMATGIAWGDTPPALWIACVLLVDVAHVWSTLYRVYAEPKELWRRPVLYVVLPIALYAIGVALYARGAMVFWRVLAYAAVFHFIRQQYGWMVLYRHRAGERDRHGLLIDGSAIYLATVYPLLWWHAASPRSFHWFVPGDFLIGLAPAVATAAGALYAASLSAYVARALGQALRGEEIPWGKHALLASTAACWYVGIVVFDSDYIFTVTNVLIHGIPYFALVWRYSRSDPRAAAPPVGSLIRLGWVAWYLPLVALAFGEEGLWDRLVWHEHPQFFGAAGLSPGAQLLIWIVPLLAVPQAVHYVLDGFIWRTKAGNPGLRGRLGFA